MKTNLVQLQRKKAHVFIFVVVAILPSLSFFLFILTLIAILELRVFRKQPIYIHKVVVRSSYTLPSPDSTCGISLGADNVGMPKPKKPEHMLQLLQHFIKHSNQIKQIHSLLTTSGRLLLTSQWINTLLYNTLIRAYLNISQPQTALILFTHMLFHQAQPNSHTFPSLIKAASSFPPRLASYIGRNLHCQVLRRGVLGDPYVCTSFIGLYSHAGELGSAHKVFDEIPEPCVVSYNAMLDACGKNGDMGLGFLMFSRMSYRDVYSWTSMIHGYMKNGCSEVAVKFFQRMMVHEDVKLGLLKPNEATFVSILSSCTFLDVGVALYLGRQVHAYMVKNEELSVFTTTALIAFYGKMGCLVYASKIFDAMASKQVCAWNAMISSLALNGREKQALMMYEKMRAKGLQPNEITFVAVLSACARAKLVDFGFKLFEAMSHEFGLVPKMEHYGCVVDLLGRAGLLQEAYDFIKKMPFEADATVLGALMGACRLHGAIELGNEVSQLLLESQPNHSGRYVQLSSIYAGAERWDHAAALRKAMLDAGIHKVPAHSLV